MAFLYPSEIQDSDVVSVLRRVDELKNINAARRDANNRIRKILNGGVEGVSELVGRDVKNARDLPAANLILDATRSLGQKLGPMPDTKVDAPVDTEKQRAKEYAEKRERIIHDLDQAANMELQMPQCGRWTPGYGFTPWIIKNAKKPNGDPFPKAQIRNPFNAFPGQWGTDQQPRDIAFTRKVSPYALAERFPSFKRKYVDKLPKDAATGGIILDQVGRVWSNNVNTGTWEHQGDSGIELVEYYNDDGTWWIVPETRQLLMHVPNPIESGPPFYVMKRFAFDKLTGQYDHAIGLMSAIARLNALSITATEDAVFAETNIVGELMTGDYEQGRKAVNHLMPGSKVVKMNDRVPAETFQQIDRLEMQLRKVSNHPLPQSGIAPTSWLTGEGLDKLEGSVNTEVNEYQTIIKHGLVELDRKRLEYLEKLYPDREFHMAGVQKGARYADTYRPRTHIKGDYLTRRVYGVMAGFDESRKIVGGLNLLQAGVIDKETLREQLSGIEEYLQVGRKVKQERIEEILFEVLMSRAADVETPQGQQAMGALLDMLPDGDEKDALKEALIPDEEEQPQQPMLPGGPGGQEIPTEFPSSQTVLSRMTNGSPATMGVQNVGRTERE